MFGYIRPNRAELKVREMDAYQAAYCGLCQSIGRRHGWVAQMFLSYDVVFLSMLLRSGEEPLGMERRRCPARLWCKKKTCLQSTPELETAADAGTILSYWKLRDGIEDGGFWERQFSRFLAMLLRRGYRKAAAALPEFDHTVGGCLDELHAMERERIPSLDRPADTFARILEAAVPADIQGERRRILEQILYHVGRWIYLVDAWDDLDEDKRSDSYNPISARFPDDEKEQEPYLRTTLRHSRNLALSAWNLLDETAWSGVIGNILCLGMPIVEELVFTGRWKATKNKNGRTIT